MPQEMYRSELVGNPVGLNTPALPDKQVAYQMKSLRESVDSLHSQIDQLIQNLYPVLLDPYPEDNKNKEEVKPEMLVPLASQIRSIKADINVGSNLLNSINNRLEL